LIKTFFICVLIRKRLFYSPPTPKTVHHNSWNCRICRTTFIVLEVRRMLIMLTRVQPEHSVPTCHANILQKCVKSFCSYSTVQGCTLRGLSTGVRRKRSSSGLRCTLLILLQERGENNGPRIHTRHCLVLSNRSEISKQISVTAYVENWLRSSIQGPINIALSLGYERSCYIPRYTSDSHLGFVENGNRTG
jgi:hypothetical protein